jgi:DNA polymerase III sliding clamp (beta) subunit (PCNA family)
MLCFVNVHNLHRTAREVVASFQRTTAAFGIESVPGLNVIEPEPEPVPQSTTTTATIDRRRFLADCRQAEKHGGRSAYATTILNYDGNRLSLDSTDGDSMLSQTVDFESIDGPPAVVVVPVKKLVSMLAKFNDKETRVSIVCHPAEGSAAVVLNVDGGEFEIPAELGTGAGPTAERVEKVFAFFRAEFPAEFATITTAGELADAFTRCRESCDTDSTRYALNGFRIEPAPDRLAVVSTDYRRLTVRNVPATTAGTFPTVKVGTLLSYVAPEELGFIFPRSSAERVLEGLKRVPDRSAVAVAAHYQTRIVPTGNLDDTITENVVFLSPLSVVIECTDDSGTRFSIRSKVVEGRFPRYADVIPKTGNVSAVADRKKLLQAITTAAAVCSEEYRGLDIVIVNETGSGELRAESPENGKSRVKFEWSIEGGTVAAAMAEDSAEFKITVDPSYIVDYLKTSTAERVAFSFVDSDTCVVVREENTAAGCFVVMPLSNRE